MYLLIKLLCILLLIILYFVIGGLTPLMLASFRSGVNGILELKDEVEDDDGSVSIINDLLMQGAKINITTERTGKFSKCHFLLYYTLSIVLNM